MTLPNWKAIPVRTKRSRRRLHNLIADEFNLDSWNELPNPIKRSKKKLFNYYAEELHLEEFKELLKKDVRSTREYYIYLKENANPSSAPTLTITVKSGDSAVSGASVTIGETTKSTGSDGKTSFTLDYDDYLVEVSKSGYESATETLAFRSNHKNFEIELEAETPVVTTGTVSVTVTYKGNPQSGEEITLSTSDDLSDTSAKVAVGTTGDDGTCTLKNQEDTEDIPFGNYYIFAVYDNNTDYTSSLTVDGDEEVTITLTSGGK